MVRLNEKISARINELFRQERWERARRLLESEREKDPHSHWVLTQLGVTFYEQRRYEDSLRLFVASQEIVPDCPLTLWNLAGALAALDKHQQAIQIYTWLLKTNKSPDDDPCWESRQWTESLKTDCFFRLATCFQHLGKKGKSEQCYRHYLNLVSLGVEGSYSLKDVQQKLRALHQGEKGNGAQQEIQNAIDSTLRAPNTTQNGKRHKHQRAIVPGLGTSQRAASKKKIGS